MLTAIESLLVPVLKDAHPDTVRVYSGPRHVPLSTWPKVVEVTALSLEISRTKDAEVEPAYHVHQVDWTTDGALRDFPLPSSRSGELMSVHTADDKPQVLHDHFELDGRLLRFYVAPPAAKSGLVATVRGHPAQGYTDRGRARAVVALAAWGKDAKSADSLMATSLPEVLKVLAALGTIYAPPRAGTSMSMSIPMARLRSIVRDAVKISRSKFYRSTATIQIDGDLRLVVINGQAAPVATIEVVEPTVRIQPSPPTPVG